MGASSQTGGFQSGESGFAVLYFRATSAAYFQTTLSLHAGSLDAALAVPPRQTTAFPRSAHQDRRSAIEIRQLVTFLSGVQNLLWSQPTELCAETAQKKRQRLREDREPSEVVKQSCLFFSCNPIELSASITRRQNECEVLETAVL